MGEVGIDEPVIVRLDHRQPFATEHLLAFLAARAVPGVEEVSDGAYRRTLTLPRGAGAVELRPAGDHVAARLWLDDHRDVAPAVQRCRRLLDLDADPVAVDRALGADPVLGVLVARLAGLRVPGHVDGAELAVRAVLGQQVSVAGARTIAGRLAAHLGVARPATAGLALTRAFPTPSALVAATDDELPMPAARRRAVRALARALDDGEVVIAPGTDRAELEARLVALPGVGPWTAAYIALRGTGDPDVFLPTDLGVRHALERLGQPHDPRSASRLAERWRPWRSYAVLHLWSSLGTAR